MKICPRCQKNIPSVQVTEVQHFVAPGHAENVVHEHRICEVCAQELNLPHTGVPQKAIQNIWNLLQLHKTKAQQTVFPKGPTCQDCGMTLEELRRRGRVGCQRDYEVFHEYLEELLERMHGAHGHVGRLPGIDEVELERIQRVTDLQDKLELAIREEDYERAAGLRDEIKSLDEHEGTGV